MRWSLLPLMLLVLLTVGCRAKTPYYHLPQGYSDTYRDLLAPRPSTPFAPPPAGADLPHSLPPPLIAPMSGERASDPASDAPELPVVDLLSEPESAEPTSPNVDAPGPDVTPVLPPQPKRAASLLPLIPTAELFDFDLLPPSPQ